MPGGTTNHSAHGGDGMTTDTPFRDHQRRDRQGPARRPSRRAGAVGSTVARRLRGTRRAEEAADDNSIGDAGAHERR